MSNRDRAVEVLNQHPIEASNGTQVVCSCNLTWQKNAEYREHLADALIAAGLIHVGQRFCTKTANCRMADGHANGCVRT